MGYLASVVNAVSSSPCVGLSLRIKISLFLLSTCTVELISTPKVITFPHMLLPVNENSERESYHMSQALYLYLTGPAFLVSLTDPNKQLPNVKFVLQSLDYPYSV